MVTISKKALKQLNRAEAATRKILDNLGTSGWHDDAGTLAYKEICNYASDIAIDIFETLMQCPAIDCEREYLREAFI